MTYTSYYIENCESKDVTDRLIRVLLAGSDAFSLIYFRYHKYEIESKSVRNIKKRLAPYQLLSQNVLAWPGTQLMKNDRGHIYQMITYSVDIEQINILGDVDSLWDWDYPKHPMDLCFYRNGLAWFEMSAHERSNTIYLRDDELPSADFFEEIGLKLTPQKTVKETELFYHKYKKEIIFPVSPNDKTVDMLCKKRYSMEALKKMLQSPSDMMELHRQYPIECCRKEENYRVAYKGEDAVLMLYYSSSGDRVDGFLFSPLPTDAELIKTTPGMTRNDILQLDPNGHYLLTGRKEKNKRYSMHCTIEGIYYQFLYDNDDRIVSVSKSLI